MEPLVSICCITYNHEKYIADAIKSFLMQETNFPIEIIIHDDASKDNTANIIRKYEKKYPDIIKPIYQKENQYSKGISITQNFIAPNVKGKYVATCEGDDFWTDAKKLQKQVDFLETHEDYIMCFHPVAVVDTNKNFTGRYLGPYGKGSREYTIKDTVIGGVLHVSSRLIRAKYYTAEKPQWMRNAKHGDYAFSLYLSAEGKVYFMDEVMSAYRKGVENSIMTNFRKNYTKNNDIEYHLNRIQTLNMADEYYKYKYHDEIQLVNLISKVRISLLQNDFSASTRKMYKDFIIQNGIIRFIKHVLLIKTPRIANFLIRFKDRFTAKRINSNNF